MLNHWPQIEIAEDCFLRHTHENAVELPVALHEQENVA